MANKLGVTKDAFKAAVDKYYAYQSALGKLGKKKVAATSFNTLVELGSEDKKIVGGGHFLRHLV